MTLIATLRSTRRVHADRSNGPNTIRLERAVQAVRDAFPGYEATPILALEETARRLALGVESWSWEKTKVGDVVSVARAVFSNEIKVSQALADFLRREASVSTNPVLLHVVCDAYLQSWQRGAFESTWLAKLIQERSRHLPSSWVRLFTSLPGLLDVERAPELLAAMMVHQSDPYEWLVSSGVPAPHSGMMMKELHLAWLKVLPEPRTIEHVEQIFRWVQPNKRSAIASDWAAKAMEKLLQPWLTNQPAADLRDYLLERITQSYGDPRKSSPEFWALVSTPCKKLMIRWLAGKSMDALLTIITQSVDNHMWPARHDFWKGLYERGLVDEAWLALSPAASKGAEQMYRDTGDPIYTMAARQISKSRRETCLLIMRIGDNIVLEGSHSYRVHIFKSDNPAALALYDDTYDAEFMTLPMGDHSARVHDPHGKWMTWVERRVRR